jgi:hypothetical protein
MTIRGAILLGAKQVVAIENAPERLAMVRAGYHHQLRRKKAWFNVSMTSRTAEIRKSASTQWD